MFTVVITEQTHLDGIEEYKPFLLPFFQDSDVTFCQWRPDGETLFDAVPELAATVSRHSRWRLIVVCGEEGLTRKNPFDLVPYAAPQWPDGMEQAEYLQLRRQAKFAAFEQAARNPLTKLMTWLCQSPTITSGRNQAEELDPEFGEYQAEIRKKEELRQQIRREETLEITLPSEILCVARRCYQEAEYDLQTSWARSRDCQYSRFYDWNLYFDKMRYLIFDTLPKNHRNYTFDYIRYLCALTLLAKNEVPQSSLNPNRVYNLQCDTDEQALRQLLARYDGKLAATQTHLEFEQRELKRKVQPRLSDQDVQTIFCTGASVAVTAPAEFETGPLYVSGSELGFSTDCPTDEEEYWDKGYRDSKRALVKFMKQPRRALKKAATELRRLNGADLDHAIRLNEFQLEDVADYVAEEELHMVSTHTKSFYNTERYDKQMEEQNKRIRTVIDKRMTRKRTVLLGIAALVCYAVSFLPVMVTNMELDTGLELVLDLAYVGVGLLALIGFATLLFLRHPIKKGIRDYNGIMKGIVSDVDHSMALYSKYLSHACNVMRGSSVLNFRQEHESPEQQKMRIFKKHCFDLIRKREELREIFGTFLDEGIQTDGSERYEYDFSRPVDYPYPLPFGSGQRRRVEFLQKGNTVEVPVAFVQRMHIRREDLYD